MSLHISPLAPNDLPALLDLIRELARFEGLEDTVEATVESLRECFFGPQQVAGALLASWEGQLAGYATYYFTFSSFVGKRGLWLDDLYIRPAFRRRGAGRALIVAVAKLAAERQCGRFEWIALNWNKGALEFYRRLGAQVMGEWVMLRLGRQALQDLATSDPAL